MLRFESLKIEQGFMHGKFDITFCGNRICTFAMGI